MSKEEKLLKIQEIVLFKNFPTLMCAIMGSFPSFLLFYCFITGEILFLFGLYDMIFMGFYKPTIFLLLFIILVCLPICVLIFLIFVPLYEIIFFIKNGGYKLLIYLTLLNTMFIIGGEFLSLIF